VTTDTVAPGTSGESNRDWIMTASGRRFFPTRPTPDQVYFPDVAHQLAQRNRFTGACREPYNVAQHSVLASLIMEQLGERLMAEVQQRLDEATWPTPAQVATWSLFGLLHDGAEAYGPDIARPVKRDPAVGQLLLIEDAIQAAVYVAADLLDCVVPPVLKLVDRQLLRAEQRDLMPPAHPTEDRGDVEPYPHTVHPWDFHESRRRFIRRYVDLQTARGVQVNEDGWPAWAWK
jgi:hypothetical protein